MSNLYNDFEKRFNNNWFSAGWVEAEIQPIKTESTRKDLATLETELNEITERIESISQKQLILSNLAKLYNN